jgi:O-antigen/teichoic acid export membrane protein
MSFFYIFHRTTGNSLPFLPYAVLTFVQLYISNNVSFYLAKLRITRQAKKFAWFSVVQCVITNALVLLLVVYYQAGAIGKLYATLVATIVFAIYSFQQSLVRWRIDKQILISALKFGFPLTISALFWYCLTGIDRLFLERIGDTNMLGIYNVGLAISGYMQIFYTTVANTFDPDIYQTIAQKNRKKLALIMGAIIGVVTVANTAFVLFAPFLIDLLTAGRYVEAAPFARILAIHNITMAIYYMVVKLLVGNGYVKGELFVRVSGAICSVVTFYVLIQHYGFYGAAWGQVLSFVVLSIIGVVYLAVKKNRS